MPIAAVAALGLAAAAAAGAAEEADTAGGPPALPRTDKPAAVAKYREAVMKAMGNHMAAMSGVVKGEVSYRDQLAVHAASVQALVRLIPTLFPAGTGPDKVKSEAKPAVWKDWPRFVAAAKALDAEAAKLVDAVQSGDIEAVKARYTATSKACGDCHDTFREKD